MPKKIIGSALLCSVLLAGCASTSTTADAPALAGRSLMWAEGITADCEVPPVVVFGEDGRVSGSSGCNNLIGSWKLEGDALKMGPLGTTMRMCAPAAMEVEKKFLDAMNAAAFVEAGEGDAVVFLDKDRRAVITLVPEKPGKCD